MGIAFSTLSRLCFAWIIVYLIFGFLYSTWTVIQHLNRLVRIEIRSRRECRSMDAVWRRVLREMRRYAAAVLRVGIMSYCVSVFLS